VSGMDGGRSFTLYSQDDRTLRRTRRPDEVFVPRGGDPLLLCVVFFMSRLGQLDRCGRPLLTLGVELDFAFMRRFREGGFASLACGGELVDVGVDEDGAPV
jgi:hypothetical protein